MIKSELFSLIDEKQRQIDVIEISSLPMEEKRSRIDSLEKEIESISAKLTPDDLWGGVIKALKDKGLL